jgi:hypothetical protein
MPSERFCLDMVKWFIMLVIWIVFVATNGKGVSALLTVVFFAFFALSIPGWTA